MHRKALAHLRQADPVLRKVIEQVGPCRLRPQSDGSHFEFIARAIIYQQLSTKAAATIHGRVQALCGGAVAADPLAGLSDDALRGAGLSRQKLGYLRDLSARASDGTLNTVHLPDLPDEEVSRQLIQVKGSVVDGADVPDVRLGRPDILRSSTSGIRKGVQRACRLRKLPDARRVEKIAAPWAPYRTVGSWYMWRVLELKATKAA
jgi:DNA-3-methyladenine glycosylase II